MPSSITRRHLLASAASVATVAAMPSVVIAAVEEVPTIAEYDASIMMSLQRPIPIRWHTVWEPTAEDISEIMKSMPGLGDYDLEDLDDNGKRIR